MTEYEAAVGDALSRAIRLATRALLTNDLAGCWQALDDVQAVEALREWDRMRSEAVLEARTAALIAELWRQ
jgi:hypothetical protein